MAEKRERESDETMEPTHATITVDPNETVVNFCDAEYVYSKQQLFDIAFVDAADRFINYPQPFAEVPYWISLAGQVSIEHAVARWEFAHQHVPGEAVTISPQLRGLWHELGRMFTEIHATVFRCWMRYRLTSDAENKRLQFQTSEEWENHNKGVYFMRVENCFREESILNFVNTGCFGMYYKTVPECYDMLKQAVISKE